jgi:3' terminal RNA ribose 2'-O-methyltransferase Hen1
MLLTISTTHKPATDLGYLLHKNPSRCQTVDLAFGSVHIFYPHADEDKCTMAMLLDIDPVEMIRGRKRNIKGTHLDHYINDRPYAASSFVSVAIAQALGSALKGQCKDRPELLDQDMPLTVKISVLPCRGGKQILHSLFEPLGYEVKAEEYMLNERFSEWGKSPYYIVELFQTTTVSTLLSHLYVLIPVLDNQKHYYIGRDEVEKLLARGQEWLGQHPEKELIAKRYLKYRSSLATEALARLADENTPDSEEERDEEGIEQEVERRINLNEERLGSVLAVLKESKAKSVVDLGCGEGRLLALLLKDKQFERIQGMDVSIRSLEIANRRLHLEDLAPKKRERIDLIHGSLMYRDSRFQGFDAATVVEVIEHMDQPRLTAFERVLFEFAKPKTIVLTTPNKEYNVVWENLEDDRMRHSDHRFEWTREEFQKWAKQIAEEYDYEVRFLYIGTEVENVGCPTQMGVFIQT